jgi:hypothetical protein
MKIGTRSILYGAHCFLLHPFFVAWAWTQLFGFPWDPRLWVCFAVHDLGYFGTPNMDGLEGERHPELGARIAHRLLDRWPLHLNFEWYYFCLFHSRAYAKKDGKMVSKLALADKLSLVLTPWWLYLPMTGATGELKEYTKYGCNDQKRGLYISPSSQAMNEAKTGKEWYLAGQAHWSQWVEMEFSRRRHLELADSGIKQIRGGFLLKVCIYVKEAIQRRKRRKKPRLRWTMIKLSNGISLAFEGGRRMSLTLPDDKKCTLGLTLLDKKGLPTTPAAPPTWSVSDVNIIAVTPSADGLSADLATGPLVTPPSPATAQVTVTVEGDPTPGVDTQIGLLDVTVVAGEVASVTITAGPLVPAV